MADALPSPGAAAPAGGAGDDPAAVHGDGYRHAPPPPSWRHEHYRVDVRALVWAVVIFVAVVAAAHVFLYYLMRGYVRDQERENRAPA